MNLETAGLIHTKENRGPETIESDTDLARDLKVKMTVLSMTSSRKRHLASKQECY